ncbi:MULTISPECIES: HD domain-containing protein [unclassified Paraburkholderia]|uniref:HD domain-containing protein n=1 Tax=unclassified Paraburkholderia TaxID=2615204 RepID=UPI002AAF1314|nr:MULTISPECIES: HD domain-containing protein [unclassified Paraburkholderia]
MERVSFTQMKDGTAEEYRFLGQLEEEFCERTADRLLAELRRQQEETLEGYRITRMEHALQSATRALRDGADDDWVVATLFHDIADGIAPRNHDRTAAEILRPYVREDVCWVIENHGLFQTYYYGHHLGWDRNARDKFLDHPLYQSAVDFCERWDQSSFDERYNNEPLETFVPAVKRVFARKPYWYIDQTKRRMYG